MEHLEINVYWLINHTYNLVKQIYQMPGGTNRKAEIKIKKDI